ncbi:MAG: STAS/SEC14 domain-containing protein [Bacteroidetes bacterium]|nr:STAS/SEC14 domain-containing protein [Bacteroidota bacterium]
MTNSGHAVFRAVFADVKTEENGLLHVQVKFEGELTREMLLEHKQIIFERTRHVIAAGEKLGVLFDVRQISVLKIPQTVMKENATEDPFLELQKGVALLVNSKLFQQIATFYIRIYRPSVATRVFTDEANARQWLLNL